MKGDSVEEIKLQSVQKTVEQIVDDMTLLDDDLMSKVFDGNIAATELLLRIILEKDDIKVKSVTGQRELKNPIVGGRNIRLDILASDSTGRNFNVEVQRRNKGADYRRARFHSSMIDTRMLEKKQDFEELLDSYVIFITEKDKIGKGLPVYHLERVIRETREAVGDGSHIIYVNGSYQGDDPIGKLMHDFRCKRSDDIYYRELADGVRHFKESEGGRGIMCDAVEEYARAISRKENKEVNKALQEAKKEASEAKKEVSEAKREISEAKEEARKKEENLAIKMLKAGKYALDEISDLTELTIDQLKTLQKKNSI
jgi:hypothetical protein